MVDSAEIPRGSGYYNIFWIRVFSGVLIIELNVKASS